MRVRMFVVAIAAVVAAIAQPVAAAAAPPDITPCYLPGTAIPCPWH